MRIRDKRRIQRLLAKKDLTAILAQLAREPALGLVNPLFAAICHDQARIRWHGIRAMGPTVARLADEDREAARVVIRRLLWSLNDESGGIGWGAPEAMAEIMVHHPGLAQEYGNLPVALLRDDGYHLEYPPLQRGALWAIARLAGARPEVMRRWQADRYVHPFLVADDPTLRGLAVLALSRLETRLPADLVARLQGDSGPVHLYDVDRDREIETTVAALASRLAT